LASYSGLVPPLAVQKDLEEQQLDPLLLLSVVMLVEDACDLSPANLH
jgi:hypothetical protein